MTNIFFASKKIQVPLGEGGGETIIYDLLCEVNRRKGVVVKGMGSFNYLQVDALNDALKKMQCDLACDQQLTEVTRLKGGKFVFPKFAHLIYDIPGAFTFTLAREDHYFISLSEYLRQFSAEAILLQAEGSLQAWDHIRKCGLKAQTWFYVQNGYELQQFQSCKIHPPRLLSNSSFVQAKVKGQTGWDSELLYPAIDIERYRPVGIEKKVRERFTVLMINPHVNKGLHLVLQLAETLKHIDFLLLEGWNSFDNSLVQHAHQRGNITLLNKTWNMAEIYAMADLLIVPSQWEEAFGRVVVEAHAAGLPTLASHVGGLPEAGGEAGFTLVDFQNPQAWETELRRLSEDRSRLHSKDHLFESNAKRFTAQTAADRFLEILNLTPV
ncbi:MAG: glycosyltransferase [Planctomycetes bacterium]|nr:glycosyltransferase [Planctomycetota bacterium]